jgi:hypothetical protein
MTVGAATPRVTATLGTGDHIDLLGEDYVSSNIGTGLVLVPFAAIEDGNGGANYTLTLVNNNSGVILSPLTQLGGSNLTARLIGDSGTSDDDRRAVGRNDGAAAGSEDSRCSRSDVDDLCSAGSPALIRVQSTGIRLPAGVSP